MSTLSSMVNAAKGGIPTLSLFRSMRTMQYVTPNSKQGVVKLNGQPVSARNLDRLYLGNIWYQNGRWVRGNLDKRFQQGTPVNTAEVPGMLQHLYQTDLAHQKAMSRGNLFTDLGDALTDVIRSPVFKAVGTGIGLVFPPALAATAAITAADMTIAALKSGNPSKIAQATQAIVNTGMLAQQGNPDAQRAVEALTQAGGQEIANMFPKVKVSVPAGIKKTASGVTFAPKLGSPITPAVKTATSLVNAAKGKMGAKAKNTAQSVMKQTLLAAKRGDKDAKRGAATLVKVNSALKSGVPSPIRTPVRRGLQAPAMASALASRVSSGVPKRAATAIRPTAGKTYSKTFLVTADGRVLRGNFKAV